MTRLSNRVLETEESITLATSQRARDLQAAGKDIIMLTLGEPDFVTPKHIQDAAIASIKDGSASFYTAANGLPALKSAIGNYMENFYGYKVAPNQIMAATGAKFVLYAFFMSILNEGDEVIIPTPYWVSYADQIQMAQGKSIFVETKEEHDFKVTVDQLKAAWTPKVKVLLINSPSNPTGMIYSREELEAISNWAVEKDILILADDIYGRLVYNGATFTPISTISEAIRAQTIVVNGVAKSYAMTGWRVGFAVGNPDIIAAMSKIVSQTTSNLTTVAQYAAIEAFTGTQEPIEDMRQAFEERLNTIYPLLADIPGFKVTKPQGAFYLFPNVKKAMEMKGFTDVTAFTEAILEEAGVALVTGAGFGAPENVRLSYATDLDTLKEAIKRIKEYMERA
ncbi:pyridoxal phosphate-dependent aminotransferase [Streptococcus sp. X16XC17]|uniref:pyridoxal phosphate-dependent aminotransferase n=1 Tax=unclassified Streptococcus TaxID=2608887 RepID=UPI00066FBB06|nr:MULTISPECIES: pyridoxal phosphate-dependent aminotransferase [unclassified Streptococcus]TCD46198.1 pyridoxal phosphate-dependent aminotransferase [Streptococcus sp. X16XC17]